MPQRAPRVQWARATLAAVAVVGIALAQHSGVPLYDGVGFPDQPYRYVQPPAGADGVPAPRGAKAQLHLAHGLNDQETAFGTNEQGPQVVLYIPIGAFGTRDADAGGTAMVAVEPVPVTAAPTDGSPNSNLYRVSVAAAADPLHLRTNTDTGSITLREATFDLPLPGFEYRPSPTDAWRHLPTTQSGRDTFDAVFNGPGDYLLVRPSGAAAAKARQAASSQTGLITALGAAVALLGATLLGIRLLTRARS